MRAECLVGNVDALYEHNQTIGKFVRDVCIPLLILGLVARLEITTCVVIVTPVVGNTSLKAILIVEQDEVTCVGQARKRELALVQLVIVDSRAVRDGHVRNEANTRVPEVVLPCQFPAVNPFFTITVGERIDVEGHSIISTYHTGNNLVRGVNAWLVSKVCEDVVTNLCVSGVDTVLSLQCRSRVVIEWAKTWTCQLIIQDNVFENTSGDPVADFLVKVTCRDIARVSVVIL